MILFKGIRDMLWLNFDNILNNDNHSNMVVGWDYREDHIYLPIETNKSWKGIYNEYCNRIDANETLLYYNLIEQVSFLGLKYRSIVALAEALTEFDKDRIGREINKWGVPFNINGNIEKQIPTVRMYLKALEQKIQITQGKANGLKPDETQNQSSIIKKKVNLEHVTGNKIDLKTCTVEEMIELSDLASIINKGKQSA